MWEAAKAANPEGARPVRPYRVYTSNQKSKEWVNFKMMARSVWPELPS